MILYRVAKEPDGPLGMAIYLLMGRAGDGVLIGNSWYHFRHGVFARDKKEVLMRKPGYIISPVREATLGDSAHFLHTVDKPWGWRFNCLTVVTPRLTTFWWLTYWRAACDSILKRMGAP